MRCTTCPASLVFPTADGTPLSAHNYERDVIVPTAHPRRYHDRAAEGTPERRLEARQLRYLDAAHGRPVKDVRGIMRHSSRQTLKAYMREIPAGYARPVDALDQMVRGRLLPGEFKTVPRRCAG